MNSNPRSRITLLAIKEQLLSIWPAFFLATLVSLSAAAITVLVSTVTNYPIWKLAKDPPQIMDYPPYIGMLSNWGVLLWMTTAAICIFSAILLKKHNAPVATIRFIAVSGALSLFLAVDDLYLFHDQLLPHLFHVREKVFYIVYVVFLFAYLMYFYRQILQYEYLLFAAAFFLFALSRRFFISMPFLDQFMTTGDMLKHFGIVFWLVFFYRTAFHEISQRMNPGESAA